MEQLIVEMRELAPLLRCGFMPDEFEVRGAKVSKLAHELSQKFRGTDDQLADLLQSVAIHASCLTVERRDAAITDGRVDPSQLPPLNQIYLNETAALLDDAARVIGE